MATFYNQATLTYNGNTINSNITTGDLQRVLTATKTAVIDTYTQDSEVTYVVNLVNAGTTDFTGLTVTDDLGEYDFNGMDLVPLTYVADSVTYFINGVLQPDPDVDAGAPLVISGITVPAGGTATVIYVARVNEFAPLGEGGTITNTAVVACGNTDTAARNGRMCPIPVRRCCAAAEAEAVITVRSEADLTITKSLCPGTVTCGGTLTYTFVIQNTGSAPVVATDDAIITDTFDPALSDLAVTFNGNVWTRNTQFSYNENTGEFATLPGRITVPAATFTQNDDGTWTVQPGVSTLTVSGTV